MYSVSEVIVVEGRYDKNTLSQFLNAHIIATDGFGIFNNREKQQLLRTLAEKRGLVVMTDPDGAGLVIRNFIKGCVNPELVKHAYVPEIIGRERRKTKPSREGKLGVEGMSEETILAALKAAGATVDGESAARGDAITVADMFASGLTGGEGSAGRRAEFLHSLGLPQKMTASAMLPLLNALMSRDEFLDRKF